jgi:nucleotide-binding universal stress UspA family protein
MPNITIDSLPVFKKLLVSTDFAGPSRAAFQTALSLCVATGAELFLLHVFEYANGAPPETGGLLLQLDSFFLKAQQSMNEMCEQATSAGIKCESKIIGGIAPLTILDVIASEKIDLAVLGTNAPRGFERLVFGSTADAVLRKAPCPVLTVGPRAADIKHTTPHDGPVVFATDFHMITTHAVEYAATYCKSTGAPLHCLHVLPRVLDGEARNKIIPHIVTDALQHIVHQVEPNIDNPVCAVTYGSEVSNAIVEYARQKRAALIVLGVRQASMLEAHMPPHIAYRIITEAPCPVLTMAFSSETHGAIAACL